MSYKKPRGILERVFDIDLDEVSLFLKKVNSFVESRKYNGRKFDGRGIVYCAGGAILEANCWASIRYLRELGCSLPVQVWYDGRVEGNPRFHEALIKLDAEAVDASKFGFERLPDDFFVRFYKSSSRKVYDSSKGSGYKLKPFAVLNSRFEEVLLLDADNYCLRDPEYLFSDPSYLKSGSIFWTDMKDSWCPPNLVAFGVGSAFEKGFVGCDTGQVVVNKSKCLLGIELANFLVENASYLYKYSLGDKDSFLISWLLLDWQLNLCGHPDVLFQSGSHMVFKHMDKQGSPLFFHRVDHFKSKDLDSPIVESFPDPVCVEYLEEYKSICNGFMVFKEDVFDDLFFKFVRGLISKNDFRVVVDFGCIVWSSKKVGDWGDIIYYGLNRDPDRVSRDSICHGKWNIRFRYYDWSEQEELPRCDLLLVNDAVNYWSENRICSFLKLIKEKAKCVIFVYWGSACNYESHNFKDNVFHTVNLLNYPFCLKGELVAVRSYGELGSKIVVKVNNGFDEVCSDVFDKPPLRAVRGTCEKDKIVLISSIPVLENKRTSQFVEVLNENLRNKLINRIVVASEFPKTFVCRELRDVLSEVSYWSPTRPRFRLADRITFSELIDLTNKTFFEDTIVIISNGDIYFDDTLSLLNKDLLKGKFLCLTRRESPRNVNCSESENYFKRGLWAADSWIFVTPCPVFGDVVIGTAYCDHIIPQLAERVGLKVLNPCYSVRSWHLHHNNKGSATFGGESSRIELENKYNIKLPYFVSPSRLDCMEVVN